MITTKKMLVNLLILTAAQVYASGWTDRSDMGFWARTSGHGFDDAPICVWTKNQTMESERKYTCGSIFDREHTKYVLKFKNDKEEYNFDIPIIPNRTQCKWKRDKIHVSPSTTLSITNSDENDAQQAWELSDITGLTKQDDLVKLKDAIEYMITNVRAVREKCGQPALEVLTEVTFLEKDDNYVTVKSDAGQEHKVKIAEWNDETFFMACLPSKWNYTKISEMTKEAWKNMKPDEKYNYAYDNPDLFNDSNNCLRCCGDRFKMRWTKCRRCKGTGYTKQRQCLRCAGWKSPCYKLRSSFGRFKESVAKCRDESKILNDRLRFCADATEHTD